MFVKPQNKDLGERAVRVSDCISDEENEGDWGLFFQLKVIALILLSKVFKTRR